MRIMLLVVGTLILVAGGCALSSDGSGNAFGADGMPLAKYYVGGGTAIDYRAQQSGTAYVVDANSKKFLWTKSLAAKEFMSVDFNNDSEQNRLQSMGISLQNSRFLLYFVPAKVGRPA